MPRTGRVSGLHPKLSRSGTLPLTFPLLRNGPLPLPQGQRSKSLHRTSLPFRNRILTIAAHARTGVKGVGCLSMQEALRREEPDIVESVARSIAGPAADSAGWRGAGIYQIYPRSFFDSNGDGIGDLPGILAKLDYVASLGVDAIWLSPSFTSPMKDFGYDVADFRGVDPVFGTLADFDRLVDRAHALGLRVIIDQVWGHSSDHHPWFVESRADRRNERADWYVWADARPDGTPPNNWLSVFGGAAWSWEPRRRQYYLHHFLASQPQLNLRNPAVLDSLIESSLFWLARGVDGFRFDAIDFLMHDPLLRDNPPAPILGGAPARPFGFQRHLHDMLHPDI